MTQPVTVNSCWQYKKTAAEVIVTRISRQEVSYIAAEKSFSGNLPLWLFLADFQPVSDKKKAAQISVNTGIFCKTNYPVAQ